MRIAIIGGTGGIGRVFSCFMVAHGASVIVVGRTFRDANLPEIEFIQADLSLMYEAQRVGKSLPAETLDLVIFTTGIMAGSKREITVEGIEHDMAISYLSRLVILLEIGPYLGRQDRTVTHMQPRIFIMGFPGFGQRGSFDDLNAEKSYNRWAVHMNTIIGNEMLVLDAMQRYPNANFFGLNPGFIKSNIRRNIFGRKMLLYYFVEWMIGLIFSSAKSYVERLTPFLVSAELEAYNGAMFNHKAQEIYPSSKSMDRSYRQSFISGSRALVAEKTGIKFN